MSIHPTAIIGPGASLGDNVEIGPFAVVDGQVSIGDNCRIGPHVHLTGFTTIGADTRIHAGAIIGDDPQDLHFGGGESYVEIGSNCVLREYVTIHRGTEPGTATVIGNHVMLMGFVHVAHNCRVGDGAVVANGTLMAGYVQVGERAFLSGGVLIHQFCRIGKLAMIGGGNAVGQDIPPFCLMQLGAVLGVNAVGLKRAGMKPDTRKAIRQAVKTYFFSGMNRDNALADIREHLGDVPEVMEFVTFAETTERGILQGKRIVGHVYGGQEVDTAADA